MSVKTTLAIILDVTPAPSRSVHLKIKIAVTVKDAVYLNDLTKK